MKMQQHLYLDQQRLRNAIQSEDVKFKQSSALTNARENLRAFAVKDHLITDCDLLKTQK